MKRIFSKLNGYRLSSRLSRTNQQTKTKTMTQIAYTFLPPIILPSNDQFDKYLCRGGASWGALANYFDDDDKEAAEELLHKSMIARKDALSLQFCVRTSADTLLRINRDAAFQRCILKATEIARDIVREQARLALLNSTKCMFCSFQRHTNPPAHFTDKMKQLCCGYCAQTGGTEHGAWCQRICYKK